MRSHESPDKDLLSACLLWLARKQGEAISRDALVAGLPLPDGRLSPSIFARAAARANLEATLVRQPLARLNTLLLPCVLILTEQRACLLLGQDLAQGKAQVIFPELEQTPVEIGLEELNAAYTGIAIYCRARFTLDERAGEPMPDRSGHWFWSVIRANRRLYRDVLIAALFINIFALTMPLFVMNVYDRVVPNQATDTLWVLALGVGLVICADLALRMLRSWFVDLAASRADITLSSQIMERVLGMRLEARPAAVGAFAANVQSFESVRGFIGSMTVTALIDLPFFLLFILIIGLIAWPMAILVLVGATAIVLYALAVQAKLRQIAEQMSQAGAQRNAGLIESLSAAETIKSFNASSRVQLAWEQATRFLSGSSAKLRLLGASVGSGAAWMQQMVSVCLLIVGVYLVIDGQMSQGALIAGYMLSSRAMAPVSQTASLLTQYHQAASSLTSLDQVMAMPQERANDKRTVSRTLLRGDIEFREVSFQYPGDDRPALANLSFHIHAGEHVGLLGRAGSGKSTVEKLILGLYRPTAGTILIDGVNIEQIDPAELRRHIGYIPQDTTLVHGTVYDNITLGAPDASPERVLEAVRIAGLNSFLGAHADGLSMSVGEGGNRLSGGQRQAVAVARAVLPRSSVLLFDEPTSAMDSTQEAHVTQALARFSVGKTLLLTTHRNSLLTLVDRLLVLDGGKLLLDGPKAEVLKALSGGERKKEAVT